MDNHIIAEHLRRHARELDKEGGNLYRVRAYRRAADLIADLNEPLTAVMESRGRRGLQLLPGIGAHIALALENLLRTGSMPPHVHIPAA
jgi:DNA polymerase (family 10)